MDHSEVKHFPKIDHTPAELDEPSKLLLASADYIEKNGHSKTSCGKGPGLARCALCSLWEHGTPFKTQWEAETRLRNALGSDAITPWNNRSSPEEVVAKLRAVALGG